MSESQIGGSRLEKDPGFLAEVIDRVGHPVFVKDREGLYVLVNRAMCEMVGQSREALLGHTDHQCFSADEADNFRTVDEKVFRTRQQQVVEAEPITDSRGARHVLLTTKSPLLSASGEATHVIGIVYDISRQTAAEQELREANEELERRVAERTAALEAAQEQLVRKERLAVLGQLAGGVAHQIRNPLAIIANAAALLRRAAQATPELSGQVEVILEEVFRANRTIAALMDYARVRPAVRVPVPVGDLVKGALGACPRPKSVRLVEELSELEAAIDADQVREALINLVHNGIDAMPQGGTLTVRARERDGAVVIDVEDTGCGIAPEMRQRLFQPLVSTKPLGLGLGLITARTLVENQGGSIGYESELGRGTRFEVRLPAA